MPEQHDQPEQRPSQRELPDLLARRFSGDSRSYWQIVWGDFKQNRAAFLALWVMAAMVVLAVFAPVIANHRPFLLFVPDSVSIPLGSPVAHGRQWPLFAALEMMDWILIFGLAQVITAWVFSRRAKRRGGEMSKPAIITMVAIAVIPVLFALKVFFIDRKPENFAIVDFSEGNVLGSIFRALLVVLSIFGVIMAVRSVLALWRAERDQLGNLATGRATFGLLSGSFLILLFASILGTAGQRELDRTNYAALADEDGVVAIFAPIQQDYLQSNTYVKSQPPLGPYVRAVKAGDSEAAVDLGLTDTRRGARLDFENTERAGPDNPVPLTEQTLLANLRNGLGVRLSETGGRDLTLISHSLAEFRISLGHPTTIGDVFDRIRDRTNGVIEPRLDATGSRIELVDTSERAPVNLMGTDGAGSDVASRILHATRVALSIGFVSTSIALFIGITMGALMGYFGGWVDIVGMRIIEIFMAIPRLFLLLTVIAFIPPEWNEYMLYAMMAVIGMFSWMTAARYIRAEFFRLRDQDFVQAAKAVGLPLRSVLFRHMLPNGVTPVLVDASFGVAAAIFIETGLSFLGFGIKPPNPSWGQMLAEAVDPASGVFNWWMAIFPGFMIFITVFAFNLIGDALRDAIDPKLKKAAH